MKALIFTGTLGTKETSTSMRIAKYLQKNLDTKGVEVSIFNIDGAGIPLFDPSFLDHPPNSVKRMSLLFRDADFLIWLTPLYHGSMPGVMKNCFDWLEINANDPIPYLMGKIVGLVCWADGVQAIQGINAMDAVAKALRAWVAPYSVAIKYDELFDEKNEIRQEQKKRFNKLLQLVTWPCL